MNGNKVLKTIFIIILALQISLFISCKPTEPTEISDISPSTEEIIDEAEEAVDTSEQTNEHELTSKEDPIITGPCYIPYFPVKLDTIWTYKVHSPSETYDYTSSFYEITDTSFIEKLESQVFNADIKWLCSSDGLVQSEYSALMLEEDDQGIEFTTESYDGVTLPSSDKWSVGYKWDTKYKIKSTIMVENEQVTFSGDIVIKNEIVAIESVTVPAGKFPEAVKIDSDKSLNISADIAGTSISYDVYTDISSWYVGDTGLVKQISEATCGRTLVELLSIEEREK